MKFRNQARLYLAVSDFEAHIFKVPDYWYGKNLTPMWLRMLNIFLVISELR